jgi:ubiquinone/menaquinone biosynthesis C-methylase UbiE
MTHRRADYTKIAPSYDDRYRHNPLDGVAEALGAVMAEVSPRRALEAGCGTGHWLCRLAPRVEAIVGLDLSAPMLLRAREKAGAQRLVQGDGCRLPFAGESFDFVFCVNALVHFPEQRRFVAETHRVLAPGGVLAIVGGDPRGRPGRWWVYEHFPEACEIDLQRCPSWETVIAWMKDEGFVSVRRRVAQRIVEPMVGRQVLTSPFVKKQGCSSLALLSEKAYAAGLRRIEQAIAEAEARGEQAVFAADLTLEMVVGRKAKSG